MRIRKRSELTVGSIVEALLEESEVQSEVQPELKTKFRNHKLQVLGVYPHHVLFRKIEDPGQCKIDISNVDLLFKYGIYKPSDAIGVGIMMS